MKKKRILILAFACTLILTACSVPKSGETPSPSETADFTRLGSSSLGNLYIGKVIHKTFISVSELGTRAGAASAVSIEAKSAPMYDYTVKLDRPFVYAIIDNAANLPIFLGTMQIPS